VPADGYDDAVVFHDEELQDQLHELPFGENVEVERWVAFSCAGVGGSRDGCPAFLLR